MNSEDLAVLLAPLRLSGAALIVHASLRSLGHIDGGAAAVCDALMRAAGQAGSLIVPAFTYGAFADNLPPRAHHTAYHPDLPVSSEIGAVAETFRRLPGVTRSAHPTHSFSAWGRAGRDILSTQRDNNPLGPLKKLNLLRGDVLLLGTALRSATAIHLAEERLGVPYLGRRTALRINASGHEERVVLEKVPGCSVAFDRLEDRLEASKFASVPLPAGGTARRIPIRYLVGLAAAALEEDPAVFVCSRPGCVSCEAKRRALAPEARRAG